MKKKNDVGLLEFTLVMSVVVVYPFVNSLSTSSHLFFMFLRQLLQVKLD